jgi:hypothetical protein
MSIMKLSNGSGSWFDASNEPTPADTPVSGGNGTPVSSAHERARAQRERLARAAALLAEQVRLAKATCQAEGLSPTRDVLPTMVQALAINYLAEANRAK